MNIQFAMTELSFDIESHKIKWQTFQPENSSKFAHKMLFFFCVKLYNLYSCTQIDAIKRIKLPETLDCCKNFPIFGLVQCYVISIFNRKTVVFFALLCSLILSSLDSILAIRANISAGRFYWHFPFCVGLRLAVCVCFFSFLFLVSEFMLVRYVFSSFFLLLFTNSVKCSSNMKLNANNWIAVTCFLELFYLWVSLMYLLKVNFVSKYAAKAQLLQILMDYSSLWPPRDSICQMKIQKTYWWWWLARDNFHSSLLAK